MSMNQLLARTSTAIIKEENVSEELILVASQQTYIKANTILTGYQCNNITYYRCFDPNQTAMQ